MAVKYKTSDGWVDVSVGASSTEVIQNAEGISIADTKLQDATESQDGIMTKEMVKELDGKFDKTGGTITGDFTVTHQTTLGRSSIKYLQITGESHATSLKNLTGVYLRRNDGYLFYRTFDEIKEDLGITGKLDKSGGAMTGYLADKNTGQVRNLTINDAKPLDSQGNDGDIWITPGEKEEGSGSGGGKQVITVNGYSELKTTLQDGDVVSYMSPMSNYPYSGDQFVFYFTYFKDVQYIPCTGYVVETTAMAPICYQVVVIEFLSNTIKAYFIKHDSKNTQPNINLKDMPVNLLKGTWHISR